VSDETKTDTKPADATGDTKPVAMTEAEAEASDAKVEGTPEGNKAYEEAEVNHPEMDFHKDPGTGAPLIPGIGQPPPTPAAEPTEGEDLVGTTTPFEPTAADLDASLKSSAEKGKP
jgi:hypothetical protein